MSAPGTRPLRLVLDTNVVVAGLLWSGPPRRLIEATLEGTATRLFSTAALIEELRHTLRYPKFAERIAGFGDSVDAMVSRYTALVTLCEPKAVPRVVANDRDDDQVIAAAVAAKADLIVSGDRKHLLPIGSHQGIGIVTVVDALTTLGLEPLSRPGP